MCMVHHGDVTLYCIGSLLNLWFLLFISLKQHEYEYELLPMLNTQVYMHMTSVQILSLPAPILPCLPNIIYRHLI